MAKGYSKKETSKRFQGTPSKVKSKMEKDPKFKAGMKEHYGVDLGDFKKGGENYKEGK